jgi:hypothetical protein
MIIMTMIVVTVIVVTVIIVAVTVAGHRTPLFFLGTDRTNEPEHTDSRLAVVERANIDYITLL